MKCYLVRHGRPKPETEDPARPLSAEGAEEAARVAAFLAGRGVAVGVIRHSGKLRAQQTAEVFEEKLRPGKGCSPARDLAPLDDPARWRDRLVETGEDIMLVGHLPHLGRLASLLTGGEGAEDAFSFGAAGVACLEKAGVGRWTLLWFLSPDILP